MKQFLVSAALAAVFAAPLAAQSTSEPGRAVTAGHGSFFAHPYAGYMIFGDLFETSNGVEYSNDNGLFYGGQLGYSFSPNISVIGNLGYTKSKFTLENVPTSGGGTATRDISDDLGIFVYDANLQVRLPFLANRMGSWVAPFAQVGAGAIKYSFDTDDLRGAGTTRVQGNFGFGADVQIMPAVGVRLMAKDYVTSLKWNDDNSIFNDVKKGGPLAHNWAITAGINFGF